MIKTDLPLSTVTRRSANETSWILLGRIVVVAVQSGATVF